MKQCETSTPEILTHGNGIEEMSHMATVDFFCIVIVIKLYTFF